MHLTPFATFQSDFPDDSVEADGDVVVPAGENIMRAIYDRLEARGYRLSHFDQHSHYGWSLAVTGKEGSFWLLVQCPDPWLLTVHDSRMIWTRVLSGRTAFATFIDVCRACLSSIPQITSASWLSRKEYETEFYRKTQQTENA